MCTSQAKERQWWNIITCHEKSNKAITWSFENKAMNKKKLSLKEKTIITTVSLSVCGNFCVVGTQSGNIYKFNMESSHFREKFIDENIGKSAHAGAIFGLCFESFNKTLISGATDSIIKVWNFEEARILRFLELRSPITKMKLHLETNLLGVTTNDFEITLIDISNMKMVREFETHFSRISDFTFHPNGRWLITTTTNGIVRVFDILSNILIDWFEFEDPPTSINFSPDERFLMTTHANSLAVHLWINKSHFMHLPTNSVNKNVPPKRFFLKAGNFSHFEEVDGKLTELDRNLLWNKNESNKDGDKNQNSNKENNQNKYDKNENKVLKKEKNSEIENLVVFSNSAKIDKWANLAFYDLIKERNRPIEPVKKMENAPFFLASLEDYNKNDEIEENDDLNKNISKFSDNKLIKILRRCEKITNYKEALEYLKKTNISKIDLDFQFIEEEEEIELFLKFFISLTNKFAHFEVVQSCLNLFFKTHSKEISRADSKLLAELSKNMNLISERLEDDVDETLCLLADVINSKN
ncbi:rRNA-processing protein utp21 [Bonamia ostreae]|uniref:rRNA-processing protein utp21 n=1 Tax=Bonamia ostreae TaxID=126728 RepID=A0ABV2AGI2_9EUKA